MQAVAGMASVASSPLSARRRLFRGVRPKTMRSILILAFGLVTVTTPLFGTSFAPPQKHAIHSPNRSVFAWVDPSRNRITVHQTASPRKTLWSIKRSTWPGTFFVSDSGGAVVFVAWKFVRTDQLDEPALIVYTSEEISFSKSYRDLSKPRRLALSEVGPGFLWLRRVAF